MIIFVLPAYNEEKNIGALIEKIDTTMKEISYDFRIILVNDGSKDRTLGVAKLYSGPITIINHEINRGLHKTIFDGLKEASKLCQCNDIVVTMDADNTHDPSHTKEMVEKIKSGCDVVVASRYEKGGKEIGLSFKRKILSKAINTILGIVFPIKGIKDYTCGFRAYNCDILKQALEFYGENLIESKTFVCMAEILIKLRKLNIKGDEVPLILRYDRKIGASKMQLKKTIVDYLYIIVKTI